MSIKAQCDEHGCSELLCGCHVSALETSSDFHEILRAKDKWIRELLDENENLKDGISAALNIEDIWIPAICEKEHEHEARALHSMRDNFLKLIKRN